MTVPSAAVAVAENVTVTVQVGLHWLFEKVAVTPGGRPGAENMRGVVVPPASVAVTDAEGLLLPRTTVRLRGEGEERLKSKAAGGLTVNDTMVERFAPPPEALIVTVVVPRAAVAVAVNETVTVHVGLHGLFVNAAITPPGKPDVENVTGVDVPLAKVAVMDEVGLVEP